MDELGRSVGDGISNALSRAVEAIGAALEGLVASIGALPGGFLWVVAAVVLAAVAWQIVR